MIVLVGVNGTIVIDIEMIARSSRCTGSRMHSAAQSATLGVGCTILAAAVRFAEMETTTVAILVIGFIFMTAPVAAHMIGRAAHRLRVPKWSGTVVDESPHADSTNEANADDGSSQLM